MMRADIDRLFDRETTSPTEGTPGRRLEIEMGATLHIKVDELKIRLKSFLVGMETGDYLIVKMPQIHHMGSVSMLLPKGKSVFVRYTHKGSVFGFSSSILGSVFSPRSLILLAFPEEVAIQNFRAHDRYDCLLPARVLGGIRPVNAAVTDIGKGGCRLEVEAFDGGPPVDFGGLHAVVPLSLKLPGEDEGIEIEGIVRHLHDHGGKVVCGVEFGDLDELHRRDLYEFILEAGTLP